MEETKLVKIKNAGCDIFPHGSVYSVKDLGTHYLAGTKELIKDWCEDFGSDTNQILENNENGGRLYASDTKMFAGCSLNLFRRMGYFHDGSRTGVFSESDYADFENYIMKNKDTLFVGTCEYKSFMAIIKGR